MHRITRTIAGAAFCCATLFAGASLAITVAGGYWLVERAMR